MITNLFYYGHYRDFVQRTTRPENANFNGILMGPGHARQAASTSSVLLNKSHDNRIFGFVNELSRNVVGLKDAAKMFIYDTDSLISKDRNGMNFENHLRWIEEDLRHFASYYQNLDSISQRVRHSPQLTNFTHNIRHITQQNEFLLSQLSVVHADEEGLSYHGFGTAATPEIARVTAETLREAYDATRDFLIHPMTQHMQFKDLNYYYNYTIGRAPDDTFRLIESGILVDIMI